MQAKLEWHKYVGLSRVDLIRHQKILNQFSKGSFLNFHKPNLRAGGAVSKGFQNK